MATPLGKMSAKLPFSVSLHNPVLTGFLKDGFEDILGHEESTQISSIER